MGFKDLEKGLDMGPGWWEKGKWLPPGRGEGQVGYGQGIPSPALTSHGCSQSLGNRRIRVDVADQAQDKGERPAEDMDQAG